MADEEFKDIPGSSIPSEAKKIVMYLKPVGNAPILKDCKFKVNSSKNFGSIITMLKNRLRNQGSIYLFCNNYCPTPDAVIEDLYQCFKTSDELIISYAITEAWG